MCGGIPHPQLLLYFTSIPSQSRVRERSCQRTMIKYLIFLSSVVLHVMAKVEESSQDYNCKGDLHHVESEYAMKNPHCDQYWSCQDKSIGTFLDSTPDCHNPCKELTAGRIVLTACVNITLAVICIKAETTESRIHFYGKMIPPPSLKSTERHYVAVWLLLGALIFVACLLCIGWWKIRNNVQEADETNG